MPTKHPKFDWIKVVAADRRLSGSQRHVLTYCAYHYITAGQDTFAVRQTTIADRCGVGVATVKRAFARARQLGYLRLAAGRRRGANQHGGDRNVIVMPGWTPAELGINSSRVGDQSAPELGINSSPKPAPDLRKRQPLGSLKTGSSVGSATPVCDKHPQGPHHSEPCRRCADVRRALADRPTPTPPQHVREPFVEASAESIAHAYASMPAHLRPRRYAHV